MWTNVTFTNLRVRNTAVGISADTSTSGIFDGVTITNNEILGTVGLDPGWGYGIEVSNPTNVLIADNLIKEATRHSVYIARARPWLQRDRRAEHDSQPRSSGCSTRDHRTLVSRSAGCHAGQPTSMWPSIAS